MVASLHRKVHLRRQLYLLNLVTFYKLLFGLHNVLYVCRSPPPDDEDLKVVPLCLTLTATTGQVQ